jgi:hypothetical protein
LTKRDRKLLRDDASDDVGAAARRELDNDADRFDGICLG